jgi:hypothetical protein
VGAGADAGAARAGTRAESGGKALGAADGATTAGVGESEEVGPPLAKATGAEALAPELTVGSGRYARRIASAAIPPTTTPRTGAT